jgi:hypothetical protein
MIHLVYIKYLNHHNSIVIQMKHKALFNNQRLDIIVLLRTLIQK